jgi:hypothetical protein
VVQCDIAHVKDLGLMTRFSVKMTAECQTGRGDDFPAPKNCAKKLPHRRVRNAQRRCQSRSPEQVGSSASEPFLNGGLTARIREEENEVSQSERNDFVAAPGSVINSMR